MSKRLEMIKRLAETDDYWRGYLDGLNRTREADAVEWREYARLTQARLDRNADTTDYDNEWTRNVTDREHATARRLGLPYPTRLDVDAR